MQKNYLLSLEAYDTMIKYPPNHRCKLIIKALAYKKVFGGLTNTKVIKSSPIEISTYSPNQEYNEKVTHMRIVIVLSILIVYDFGDH